MIVGIGCDVVHHALTEQLGWRTNLHNLRRVFSQKELQLYQINSSIRFISGRFAVKEAVLKCLGTGMKDGIALIDIQVLQTDSGKPVLEIGGEVKRIAAEMEIIYWHISLTHTDNSSTAFVIAER